jgi:hypothetical protein
MRRIVGSRQLSQNRGEDRLVAHADRRRADGFGGDVSIGRVPQ